MAKISIFILPTDLNFIKDAAFPYQLISEGRHAIGDFNLQRLNRKSQIITRFQIGIPPEDVRGCCQCPWRHEKGTL
jgi:hypothetical protein